MNATITSHMFIMKQTQLQQLEKELNKHYYPIVSSIFKHVSKCYSNPRTTEKEAEECIFKWDQLYQKLSQEEKKAKDQCKHMRKIKKCITANANVIECMQKGFDQQTKCMISNYTKVYKQYSKLVYIQWGVFAFYDYYYLSRRVT